MEMLKSSNWMPCKWMLAVLRDLQVGLINTLQMKMYQDSRSMKGGTTNGVKWSTILTKEIEPQRIELARMSSWWSRDHDAWCIPVVQRQQEMWGLLTHYLMKVKRIHNGRLGTLETREKKRIKQSQCSRTSQWLNTILREESVIWRFDWFLSWFCIDDYIIIRLLIKIVLIGMTFRR